MFQRVASFTGGVAAAALGLTTVANAQVVSSFHDLQGSLRNGDRLTVTDRSGTVTQGKFVTLSTESLQILLDSGQSVAVDETSVATIHQVKSRTGKGALAGLVTGALFGALAVALTRADGWNKESFVLPAAGLFGAIGTGIGAGIGALRPERKLRYLAPTRQPDAPADRMRPRVDTSAIPSRQ